MKHSFVCLFMALGMAAPLCAQESKLPPLPDGPLLKRAPDYSTWTITFQGHPMDNADKTEAPSPSPGGKTGATGTTAEGRGKKKEIPTAVMTIVKTGTMIFEQTVDENGQRHQVWHSSGRRIVPVAGEADPMICPDYGGGDILSTNFATSDFAGLDWLSPTTYSGVEKYQGNDCIMFKASVSPLSVLDQADERASIAQAKALGHKVAPAAKVAATAYIDLQTRLPAFVQFGNEKRIYQFGTPPEAPIKLSDQLTVPEKKYEQKMKRLSAPATKAF